MQLDAIRAYVHDDMKIVDELIADRLGSEIGLIKQLGDHVFSSGGKRLRPILVIVGARVFGYQGEKHKLLAAVVELIHTATLLHDDVVDNSGLRRGQETANKIWGNEASVLVGDFLYSRAFQMMVEVGNMRVLEVLANAANTIAEGEVMQLINCFDPEVSESRYMETIGRKTATLFEASAQLGAILCDRNNFDIEMMASFGRHLGLAFQLVDDALDFGASDENIGKNIGDDLAEGKPTLPLIHAMRCGTPKQIKLISESIKHARIENLAIIKQAIEATDAIDYTYKIAKKHAELAISCLAQVPLSPAHQILYDLANFAVSRKF